MKHHIHPFYYLGCGGDGPCGRIGDGSDGDDEMDGRTFLFSMTIEKRLEEVPRLSMDLMYSDALVSIIKASSSSRSMVVMGGREAA